MPFHPWTKGERVFWVFFINYTTEVNDKPNKQAYDRTNRGGTPDAFTIDYIT